MDKEQQDEPEDAPRAATLGDSSVIAANADRGRTPVVLFIPVVLERPWKFHGVGPTAPGFQRLRQRSLPAPLRTSRGGKT